MHPRHLAPWGGLAAVAALVAVAVPARAAEGAAMVVLAYNVLGEPGADDDATLALLAEQQAADVVCLEELSPALAKRIEHGALAKVYPHRALFPKAGTWGLGILSKTPLAHVRVFPQAPHKMPAVEADVGGRFHLACVHLFPPAAKRFAGDDVATTMKKNAALRVAQAKALAARMTPYARVVIAGDFNEGADDDAASALRAAGFSRAPTGATWPGATSPLPALFAVDHVWARGLALDDAHVVKGGGSDHFAVRARVVPP